MTTGGFSAAYGQATGGIFNFVTKSGGNSFRGTANFHIQTNELQSNNISDELRQLGVTAATSVDHIRDWGGNLGGPVVREQDLGSSRATTTSTRRSLAPTFPTPSRSISGKPSLENHRAGRGARPVRGVVFEEERDSPPIQRSVFHCHQPRIMDWHRLAEQRRELRRGTGGLAVTPPSTCGASSVHALHAPARQPLRPAGRPRGSGCLHRDCREWNAEQPGEEPA